MILFVGISLIAFCGMMYFVTLQNIHIIRDNWSSYRCNPLYMPMAYVQEPGGFEAVGENFEYCMAMMSKSVVGEMNDALGSQFSLIGEAL
jgi:hypothetical protein